MKGDLLKHSRKVKWRVNDHAELFDHGDWLPVIIRDVTSEQVTLEIVNLADEASGRSGILTLPVGSQRLRKLVRGASPNRSKASRGAIGLRNQSDISARKRYSRSFSGGSSGSAYRRDAARRRFSDSFTPIETGRSRASRTRPPKPPVSLDRSSRTKLSSNYGNVTRTKSVPPPLPQRSRDPPPLTAVANPYSVGDEVDVYSRKHKRWFIDGRIDLVRDGRVHVIYNQGRTQKWILKSMISKSLRPSKGQSAPKRESKPLQRKQSTTSGTQTSPKPFQVPTKTNIIDVLDRVQRARANMESRETTLDTPMKQRRRTQSSRNKRDTMLRAPPAVPPPAPRSVLSSTPLLGQHSPSERVLQVLNFARTKPSMFAHHIYKQLHYLRGHVFQFPNRTIGIRSEEGRQVYEEAIKYLEKQASVPPLKWSPGLSKAAQAHVDDIGPRGLLTHEGSDGSNMAQRAKRHGDPGNGEMAELVEFPLEATDPPAEWDAMDIVASWVVDDGDFYRSNRKSVFNAKFQYIGIADGIHKHQGHMVVAVFAETFVDAGSSPKHPASRLRNVARSPALGISSPLSNNSLRFGAGSNASYAARAPSSEMPAVPPAPPTSVDDRMITPQKHTSAAENRLKKPAGAWTSGRLPQSEYTTQYISSDQRNKNQKATTVSVRGIPTKGLDAAKCRLVMEITSTFEPISYTLRGTRSSPEVMVEYLGPIDQNTLDAISRNLNSVFGSTSITAHTNKLPGAYSRRTSNQNTPTLTSIAANVEKSFNMKQWAERSMPRGLARRFLAANRGLGLVEILGMTHESLKRIGFNVSIYRIKILNEIGKLKKSLRRKASMTSPMSIDMVSRPSSEASAVSATRRSIASSGIQRELVDEEVVLDDAIRLKISQKPSLIDWNTDDVSFWLSKIDSGAFQGYRGRFESLRVTGHMLMQLREEDVQQFGIPPILRQRFLKQKNALQAATAKKSLALLGARSKSPHHALSEPAFDRGGLGTVQLPTRSVVSEDARNMRIRSNSEPHANAEAEQKMGQGKDRKYLRQLSNVVRDMTQKLERLWQAKDQVDTTKKTMNLKKQEILKSHEKLHLSNHAFDRIQTRLQTEQDAKINSLLGKMETGALSDSSIGQPSSLKSAPANLAFGASLNSRGTGRLDQWRSHLSRWRNQLEVEQEALEKRRRNYTKLDSQMANKHETHLSDVQYQQLEIQKLKEEVSYKQSEINNRSNNLADQLSQINRWKDQLKDKQRTINRSYKRHTKKGLFDGDMTDGQTDADDEASIVTPLHKPRPSQRLRSSLDWRKST